MDVVEMVLGGRVNKGLVNLIQQAGGQAVGLCGKDSNIIRARQMVEKDIGFVGDITSVNKDLIEALVKEQYIPVVASVAADPQTGQALNVNADIAAGEVRSHFIASLILCAWDLQQAVNTGEQPDLQLTYTFCTTHSGMMASLVQAFGYAVLLIINICQWCRWQQHCKLRS